MKIVILVFSCLLILTNPVLCPGADTANFGNPMPDEEKKAVMEHLRKLQKEINSMTAKISQTKKNRLLKKDAKLEGAISLKKPNLMRWEIDRPEKTITTVNEEKMIVYRPDAKEAQVYEFAEDVVAKNTASFFSSSLSMSFEDMEKRFHVSIYRAPENIVFELKPRSKTISKYLGKILLWYNENTGLPSEFEVAGARGDITHTWLKDIVVNPELKPELFNIKLSEEVWITNKVSPVNPY